MSKIINLNIKNYKAVEAFEATPEGNIITINGPNGAGKSSVLDAIAAALGGVNKKTTPKPIRDGETSAEIVLETDELVVTRRFTPSGSTLTVSTHDGAKFPKGQAKLDDLLGKLSLDPFAFTQLSEKEQLETLLNLVDLPFDPAELERKRKHLFDERAAIGRDEKAIGQVIVDESLPDEEEVAGHLINKIRQTQQRNDEIRAFQSKVDGLRVQHDTIRQQIEKLMQQLAQIEDQINEGDHWLQHNGQIVDTEDMEARLSTIEESNAVIRANNTARDKQREKELLSAQYDNYTEKISTLDQQKKDGLADAIMPVPGLGFDEHGVTFEGIPFKQTNTASQIRVSFAMAMALNPKLRVVRIAEGSLLDDDNMRLIADMANEHDYQVWIERVGDGDGTGIVIEEGKVKA